MTTTTDPIAERFAEWRDRYTNRRTVPWELLDQATHLVQASRDYHAREARAAVAAVEDRLAVLEEQHARELERAGEREQRALERAERAERSEREYRQQQTNLREQRETVEDGVQVRISAPRIPGYGDRTHPRPWTLGELDQIHHRLRAGGATDDTEVRFAHEHVEACIPFPEMVLEQRRTPVLREPSEVATRRRLPVPGWRLTLGLVLVVVAMVCGAVVL